MVKSKPWQDSERDAAEIFNAKRVPFSGALVDNKLDLMIDEGILQNYLIENKFTSKESFSLKKDVLKKAFQQAAMMGKKFFLRLDFGEGFVFDVIPERDFLTLLSEIPNDQ